MHVAINKSIRSVLEPMLINGKAATSDGSFMDISSFALSHDAAMVLAQATRSVRPETIIEVGCASAVSTMTMAEAAPQSRVIAMDPKQETHWKGAGRLAIENAELADRVTLHLERSDVLLPKLIEQGVTTQLAFIDGWHMLDYAIIEAHLVDRMLDVGGVILMNDLWMPALQHFACFWTTNRGYEPVTFSADAVMTSPWLPEPTMAEREVRLTPTTPPRFVRELLPFVDHSILALRKTGEDARKWDDFADYID